MCPDPVEVVMEESGLPQGFKRNIDEFVGSLRKLYSDDLVCVILYGSAASGELTEVHSNINLLVVLKRRICLRWKFPAGWSTNLLTAGLNRCS